MKNQGLPQKDSAAGLFYAKIHAAAGNMNFSIRKRYAIRPSVGHLMANTKQAALPLSSPFSRQSAREGVIQLK